MNEKVSKELESLLENAKPKQINRSIIDVFFIHLMESNEVFSEKLSQQAMHIYYLIKFFQVAEDSST